MNKRDQLRVVKDEFSALLNLRKWSPPDDFMPEPKAVLESQKRILALEHKVRKFSDRRDTAWGRTFAGMDKDKKAIRRAIAFDEPVDVLKMIDAFRKKYAKYYDNA